MALGRFDDRNGEGWQVWRVVPGSSVLERSGWMEGEYRNGWLCFESLATGERRRLAPVPENWESLPSERLELMCRVASPARRSTPAKGVPVSKALESALRR